MSRITDFFLDFKLFHLNVMPWLNATIKLNISRTAQRSSWLLECTFLVDSGLSGGKGSKLSVASQVFSSVWNSSFRNAQGSGCSLLLVVKLTYQCQQELNPQATFFQLKSIVSWYSVMFLIASGRHLDNSSI